ncbi:MAG: D-methionine transport system permease protein [Chloroflexota bacterium]|nr:D-methionine transport system permease protein [Chloroflexota bacterium]
MDDVLRAGPEIVKALVETFTMLVITIPLAVVLGTLLGTVLFLTRPGSLVRAPRLYVSLNAAVNVLRSFPFLILLVAMIPITRFIVGTSLGTIAVTVPMIVNAVPYFGRLAENALLDVSRGVIEAGQAMGMSRWQLVRKVLYVEARSGLANCVTIVTVSFLGYSTVAGLVGGGGIGDFAIRWGYYRYETNVMVFTVALMVLFVQAFQFTGNRVVRALDKRA